MLALNTPLKRLANPTHALPFIQPARLIRFTLLFLMLVTPVLLSLVPSQGEANYFLSAQIGDHSYGLPTYCQSVTATLTQCTPIGTLPLSSETSSLPVKGLATPFHGSSENLECSGGLTTFYCGRSLTQLSSVTTHEAFQPQRRKL
jgi:hypothetical protein